MRNKSIEWWTRFFCWGCTFLFLAVVLLQYARYVLVEDSCETNVKLKQAIHVGGMHWEKGTKIDRICKDGTFNNVLTKEMQFKNYILPVGTEIFSFDPSSMSALRAESEVELEIDNGINLVNWRLSYKENEERLEGIGVWPQFSWLKNAHVRYLNGKLEDVRTGGGTTIFGTLFRWGMKLKFTNGGDFDYVELSHPHKVNGKIFRAGTLLGFDSGKAVSRGWLDPRKMSKETEKKECKPTNKVRNVAGYDFPVGSMVCSDYEGEPKYIEYSNRKEPISFGNNNKLYSLEADLQRGELSKITLAESQSWGQHSRVWPKGTVLWLGEHRYMIQKGFVPKGTVINGQILKEKTLVSFDLKNGTTVKSWEDFPEDYWNLWEHDSLQP